MNRRRLTLVPGASFPQLEKKPYKRRESLGFLGFRKQQSSDSKESVNLPVASSRVVVLGGPRTGKTAIISQFLYDEYPSDHRETIEEMYRGDFEVEGTKININIQDTGGSYVYEFPSMVGVSLHSANAAIIVFALDDQETFEEARRLRDLVMSTKGPDTPIVIVGNKSDAVRELDKSETEATVVFDWENGYVECSAKLNSNIQEIFKEVLTQTKSTSGVDFRETFKLGRQESSNSSNNSSQSTPVNMRRRQSLPQVPAFNKRLLREEFSNPAPAKFSVKKNKKKLNKESCKVS